MMNLMLLQVVVALAFSPLLLNGMSSHELRHLAAKGNVSCILVFGDSSVDPGNNDFLATDMKANFLPYGQDFFDSQPTGRFTNGRLTTDFIAEALGFTKAIPAFLGKINRLDLLHGVSFASAATGYDDYTANISNVLPFRRQLDYLRHHKIHLRKLAGAVEAEKIVNNAVFLLSMGTNDFLQNYYLDPLRPNQFTLEQYQRYLASLMYQAVQMLHREGARRLVVVGVPPIGCMPLVKTLANKIDCAEDYNKVAFSFNSKIQRKLATSRIKLGIKVAFVDTYAIIQDAINNPNTYGFSETSKGCCGSGTYEYGITCKGMSTCSDASKYVFWDAVHPSERMYQIIADKGLRDLRPDFLT